MTTKARTRRRNVGFPVPEDDSRFRVSRCSGGDIAIIPLPPSVNDLWVGAGKNRRRSKLCKEYMEYVSVKLARMRTPEPGPLLLRASFMVPDLVKRDLDNMLKVSIDALCNALGIDDGRITQIETEKILSRSRPGAVLHLSRGFPMER